MLGVPARIRAAESAVLSMSRKVAERILAGAGHCFCNRGTLVPRHFRVPPAPFTKRWAACPNDPSNTPEELVPRRSSTPLPGTSWATQHTSATVVTKRGVQRAIYTRV